MLLCTQIEHVIKVYFLIQHLFSLSECTLLAFYIYFRNTRTCFVYLISQHIQWICKIAPVWETLCGFYENVFPKLLATPSCFILSRGWKMYSLECNCFNVYYDNGYRVCLPSILIMICWIVRLICNHYLTNIIIHMKIDFMSVYTTKYSSLLFIDLEWFI